MDQTVVIPAQNLLVVAQINPRLLYEANFSSGGHAANLTKDGTMTFIKLGMSALLIFVMSTLSATAQSNAEVTSDPIPCLLASHDLDDLYRQSLQPQCLALAGDYCAKSPDAGACLVELNTILRALYSDLSGGLPTTIDGDEAAVKRYNETVARAAVVFENNPDCQRYDGISLEACALKTFSEQITILIEYAEQTASWP